MKRARSLSTASNRQSNRRLRSRNSVIDRWLSSEKGGGTDSFADLEDFIV